MSMIGARAGYVQNDRRKQKHQAANEEQQQAAALARYVYLRPVVEHRIERMPDTSHAEAPGQSLSDNQTRMQHTFN